MKNITGIESSVLFQIAEANKKVGSVDAFKNGDTYHHEECCEPGSEDFAENACEDSHEEGFHDAEEEENILYSHLARTKDISKNLIGISVNHKI